MKDAVHESGDPESRGIVDPIAQRVGRIANEHTTERFRIQLTTLIAKKFFKSSVAKHHERRSV
jgi:hypothetical protein